MVDHTTHVAFTLASSSDDDSLNGDERNESETNSSNGRSSAAAAGATHEIDGQESDDSGEGFLQGMVRAKPDTESPSIANQGPWQSNNKKLLVEPPGADDAAEPHDHDDDSPRRTKSIYKPTCPLCKRAFATESEMKYHVEKGVCSRDLHGIGRKTRQSLQNARSVRAVVQRVDPVALEQEERTSITIPVPRVTKRQKRSAPHRAHKQREALNVENMSNVDRWMPDIAVLPPRTHQTSSNIVQLHGLPATATPESIVRFFAGLSVRKVWLLPPFSNHVVPWDADHSIHRKRGFHVQRSPATLRVLVKFQDTATAELAASRSGELVRAPMEARDESDDGVDAPVECEASVAVTLLRKDDASFVTHNYLVIDASSKVSLEKTIVDAQASLPSSVSQIIWKRMIRDLNLDIRPLDSQESADESLGLTVQDRPTHPMMPGPEYEQAVQRHAMMLAEYHRLLLAQQCIFDPTLLDSDSIYRLTTKAIGFLKQDITELSQRLLQSRRWRLFKSPAFKTTAVS